jgi:adenylate cyclase
MASNSRRRDLLTTVLIALIAAAVASLPQLDRLRGLSIDVLTWLKWSIAGPLHDPARSPTVVIALDEETYRRKPFAGTPSITWTPEIGKILTAVVDGGAKVVGLDVIFPTSLEQSEISLGGDTVGDRLRGFDRSFLRALALAARPGKLVLGQVQHLHQPIQPFEAQRIAVGQYANIRPLNLHADRDGVVRRVPLSFEVDGGTTPSMAVELVTRAIGVKPEFAADGSLTLAGMRVPQSTPNTLMLNFEGGADDIPTYSLADLAACADAGDKDYFQRQFNGRVVLIGALLDVEDRSVASKRFATGIEGARAPRCRLAFEPPEKAFARDSIAGVYVHATAVNNLIRGDPAARAGPRARLDRQPGSSGNCCDPHAAAGPPAAGYTGRRRARRVVDRHRDLGIRPCAGTSPHQHDRGGRPGVCRHECLPLRDRRQRQASPAQ